MGAIALPEFDRADDTSDRVRGKQKDRKIRTER
jgi:hypothetical protein